MALQPGDAFVSMFINEARISATLSHGNIAQVFGFGRVERPYFLAMELVDGAPLHRIVKRALGIVHRDNEVDLSVRQQAQAMI